MGVHADCDNGPTKSYLVANAASPSVAASHALCFGKRPAIELYDCRADPEQVRNLAGREEYAEVVSTLRGRLVASLKRTGDPRFGDEPCPFDGYPYRARYLKKHLEKQRR
jgi:hypothetical protein